VQVLPDFEGFDWDAGNRDKNWHRHNVAWWDARSSSSTSRSTSFPTPDIQARSLVSTRWESRVWGARSSSSLRDAEEDSRDFRS